jgi:hypothetical protein
MKISKLIDELQKLAAKHGDLDILFENNGCLADVESVCYMREYSLPPIFVISDRVCVDFHQNRKYNQEP